MLLRCHGSGIANLRVCCAESHAASPGRSKNCPSMWSRSGCGGCVQSAFPSQEGVRCPCRLNSRWRKPTMLSFMAGRGRSGREERLSMSRPPPCLRADRTLFKGLGLSVQTTENEIATEWIERACALWPNLGLKGLRQLLPSDFV